LRQPPQAALPAVAFLTPGAAPQRAYRLIAPWQMRKEQAKACLRAPVRLRPRGLPPPPAVLSRSSRSSPECLAGNKRWLSSAPVSSAGQWQLEGWQSEQAILPPCQKTCRLFRDRPGQQRMPNHCLDGATLLDMAYMWLPGAGHHYGCRPARPINIMILPIKLGIIKESRHSPPV
jgi:hypothetical protein